MLLYESVSMKNSGRVIQSDKRFCSSAVRDEKLINVLFERLVAMKVQFNQVDFSYCIFDAAYLRNCSFIDCNFTGCRFLNSNLSGTSFHGCKFDYATFEKTYIDNDVLDTGCPGFENLKLKFARSLRLNYQQIGDAKSSNKAMAIELEATESHLFKAWNSKEAYYRHKYKDLKRFKVFMDWLCFKALDIIWGNGESALKLVRTVLWALLIIAAVHLLIFEDIRSFEVCKRALLLSVPLLLGVSKPPEYPDLYLTSILLFRLIMFSFFMSIIIKKYNRR